jgi:hypothetical protein
MAPDPAVPALPTRLAAALRPVLPGLADETIAAIGREVPDYARPLEGPFGVALSIGVQHALERFVDAIADGQVAIRAGEDTRTGIYVELGRGEQRTGRSLDALLSAYRLGARLAWERFVVAAEAAGEEPRTLYALAGAIFGYIDAISAGEHARRRRALVRALVREDTDPDAIAALALDAEWPVPATLSVLVVHGEDVDADRLASRLGLDVIAAAEGDHVAALIPDPAAPGRRAQLAAALPGAPAAALGPEVPPTRAAASHVRAVATLRLLQAGRITGPNPVATEDHLIALLLHGGDPALAADLAAQALAPLDGLTPVARERLLTTLRVWLDHPGRVQQIAGLLDVHPQTVRYRVARLYERFGEALDDPERRFGLALALRVTG